MVEGSSGGVIKTLDEVEVYFWEKEYVVLPYSNLAEGQKGIGVLGRLKDVDDMGIHVFGSNAVIISSGNSWILRTLYVPYPLDEPFDTLQDLLIVAEERLGPPKEPPKES